MDFFSKKTKTRRFVSAVTVSIAGLFASSAAQADDNIVTPELHRLGQNIYAESCAICHGVNGEGDGSLATEFTPRPRNFTFANFKFGSTGLGDQPARADIIAVIKNGIEGSYGRSMPAFRDFTDSELLSLVEVVRQFAEIESYGTPITVPDRKLAYRESRAKALYASAGCIECHGIRFDGQGPAAEGMTDQNGLPIAPADFTTGKFKGGADLTQIWLRIAGGIPGTPMPSFGQNLTAEEIWALTMLVSAR